MSVLKVRAKVKLTSEENMEMEGQYDLGNIAKSSEWVWRNVGIPIEEIYKIVEFSSAKSILQLYDTDKILVFEPFDDLYGRWREMRELHSDKIGDRNDWQETEEQEEDD